MDGMTTFSLKRPLLSHMCTKLESCKRVIDTLLKVWGVGSDVLGVTKPVRKVQVGSMRVVSSNLSLQEVTREIKRG